MASNQLIGSRISLISKKEIRYEGTLYMIDAANASVTLQNVKSWGTEDRLQGKVVPPTDELFSCIVFRGSDIKDLHIHDSPVEAKNELKDIPPTSLPNSPMAQPEAPKIAEPAPSQSSHNEEVKETEPKKKVSALKPEKFHPPNRSTKGHHSNRREHKDSANPTSIPGMGNHLATRKTKGGDGILVEKNEFDFQAALDQFDKDALKEEVLDTDNNDSSTTTVKKYDKSNFFDEISCDATDGRQRISGQYERSLNSETFGATSVAYSNRKFRGRGRGYHRGRGGYRRYNNHNNDRRNQDG